MRAEWVRTYSLAEPTVTHLVLFAGDDSELVRLERDEITLLSKAIRSEDREDVARVFAVPASLVSTVEIENFEIGGRLDPAAVAASVEAKINETVGHTGAGNAGVVSEPDSPPAVVGDLDDAPEVVEAPPEHRGQSVKVTNDQLIAWLQVNPGSSVPEICRHFGYSSNGSMYARLQKLRGSRTAQDPVTKHWSALTVPADDQAAPPAPPKSPVKKTPTQVRKNSDFRGPPAPPRPTHSNPADDLHDQLVDIVETHGPLTPTLAFSCLPTSVRNRCSINDVSNQLRHLLDTGRIARPRIGVYEAAS